jgi:eukaryotic-like serine/threonine-protein kinase
MNKLKEGSVISTDIGKLKINKLLGEGGQGAVYHVTLNSNHYALKVYHQSNEIKKMKDAIETLIAKKQPSDKFVWPQAIINFDSTFGYIMDIRPEGFKSLQAWLKRQYDMELHILINACIQLTDSFHKLHSKGLCYQDLNLGGVFINPIDGDILIVDNDNVVPNNHSSTKIFTYEFVAPELLLDNHIYPSINTDRYSLAILLFNLLMVGHPLNGEEEQKINCMDIPAKQKLYAKNPIFVYDPMKTNNRPVKGVHDAVIALWNIYPQYIKDLFIRTFTVGINDPYQRARESEWRKALIRFESNIYRCPSCKKSDIIYDSEQYAATKSMNKCRRCNNIVNIPRMKLNEFIIIMSDKRKIYNVHVNPKNDDDMKTVFAEVNYDNGRLTINNKTNHTMYIIRNDQYIDWHSNQSIELQSKDQIDFTGNIGVVRF